MRAGNGVHIVETGSPHERAVAEDPEMVRVVMDWHVCHGDEVRACQDWSVSRLTGSATPPPVRRLEFERLDHVENPALDADRAGSPAGQSTRSAGLQWLGPSTSGLQAGLEEMRLDGTNPSLHRPHDGRLSLRHDPDLRHDRRGTDQWPTMAGGRSSPCPPRSPIPACSPARSQSPLLIGETDRQAEATWTDLDAALDMTLGGAMCRKSRSPSIV